MNINHVKSSKNSDLLKNTYTPSIQIDYLKKKIFTIICIQSTKLGTALYFKSVFICNRIPIMKNYWGIIMNIFLKMI